MCALLGDIDRLRGDIESDTRNVILTPARIWSMVATGAIRSRDAAADWVLDRLPEAHRPAQQRDYFFGVLRERFPDLLPLYERLYPPGSYGPVRSGDPHAIGRRIRELCRQYGISDRMPRPNLPGDKRALNKRIVEALANQVYYMELSGEPSRRVWAYRKAAWAIEDLEVDIGLIYRQMGRKGLESTENVGPRLAEVVEDLLLGRLTRPTEAERR